MLRIARHIAQFPIENHSEQGQFADTPLKPIGKSAKFGIDYDAIRSTRVCFHRERGHGFAQTGLGRINCKRTKQGILLAWLNGTCRGLSRTLWTTCSHQQQQQQQEEEDEEVVVVVGGAAGHPL